jgi:hypothetical protein
VIKDEKKELTNIVLSKAGREYLQHIRMVQQAQSDAYRYLAGLWQTVHHDLARRQAWPGKTTWKVLPPWISNDWRVPYTNQSDPSGTYRVSLRYEDSSSQELMPDLKALLKEKLEIRTSDGRYPHPVDGDCIDIRVHISSKPARKTLDQKIKREARLQFLQALKDLPKVIKVELHPSNSSALGTVSLKLDFDNLAGDVAGVTEFIDKVLLEVDKFIDAASG